MPSIARSSPWPLVLILVTVVALSATAATIDSTVGAPSGQEGFDFDPGNTGEFSNESGGDDNGGGEIGSSGRSVDMKVCVEALRGTPARLAVLFGVVLLLGGLYYRYNAATTLLAGSAILPIVTGGYFFLTNCSSAFGGGESGGFSNPASGGGAVEAPSVPPTVLAIALVGVIGIVAAVLVTATRSDEQFQPVEDEPDEDPDASDFAAAAGRAADRIEQGNVAVDNAVYRAWLEMTNLLALPDPDSSAPLDFAEAAVDAGLSEADVMELTELFNEVRYGHMDPERREERAVEILRHIESEYETVSDDADDSSAGGDD